MRLFRRRSTDTLADPQLTGLRFDQVGFQDHTIQQYAHICQGFALDQLSLVIPFENADNEIISRKASHKQSIILIMI